MKKILTIFMAMCFTLGLAGCSTQKYKDGLYKAEFDKTDKFGWKGYEEIQIKNNEIVSIAFNYMNTVTGLKKTDDVDYNKQMKTAVNTNAIEYTLKLENSMLQKQNPDKVDAVSGATSSSNDMKTLTKAALEQAKTGQTATAIVPLPKVVEKAKTAAK